MSVRRDSARDVVRVAAKANVSTKTVDAVIATVEKARDANPREFREDTSHESALLDQFLESLNTSASSATCWLSGERRERATTTSESLVTSLRESTRFDRGPSPRSPSCQ